LRELDHRQAGAAGAENHRQAVADLQQFRHVQRQEDEAQRRDKAEGRRLS
jgi:hypothetical protein